MAGIPFDGSRVHDSDSINGLGFLPTSVVITGSGVIAIEYAQIFRKLGAEVTMLVRGRCADGLARVGIDVDVARMLIQSMRDGEECERSARPVAARHSSSLSATRALALLRNSDPSSAAQL
jgi:pyruvate/2-oxoglutarate dehydrogenase complex dihydrolipoamide dehydrogenase (E3) component